MQVKDRLAELGLTREQLTAVTALFSEFETEHGKAMDKLKLDHAINTELTASKVKNVNIVKKALELENVKLNDAGELEGLSEQLNALKESDPYLFGTDTNKSGVAGYNPGNGGLPTGLSQKDPIWGIGGGERIF